MRSYRLIAVFAVALATVLTRATAESDRKPGDEKTQEHFYITFELDAGPLLGLDEPLRGASGGVMLGLGLGQLGLGLSSHAAYDRTLDFVSISLDLGAEIGDGLRIIVGGVLPLTSATLDPEGAALPLTAANWPSRFGLATRLIDSNRGLLGSRFRISAEIVYTAYRVEEEEAQTAKAALSGARAFAACIEIRITAALAWNVAL